MCTRLGSLDYRGTSWFASNSAKFALALLITAFAVLNVFTSKSSPAIKTSDMRNLRIRIVNPSPNALLIVLKIAGARCKADEALHES